MALISVQEARATIHHFVQVAESEEIPLGELSGRVNANEVVATFPQPRFNNTAMDGFALKAADIMEASQNSPVRLALKGTIPAGGTSDFEIGHGECCQIMTGAPMPAGADAVVKVEDTSGFETTENVEIFAVVEEGQNVRYSGEEVSKGQILIEPGKRLGAGEIGVAATFGYDRIEVYGQPRVALFATGDELIEPGISLGDGQIYNSNLYVFAELSNRVGAEVSAREVLKDNRESLKLFLKKVIGECDLVISSGGVSMGRHDYVRDVFLDMGVEEHFWRVAQKPGGPFFFGTANETLIFGLPGNPVSSFICFMEYVWPVCELISGLKPAEKVTATLETSFPREPVKHRFLPGTIIEDEGQLKASPTEKLGSHMFSSSLGANAILEVAPGKSPLEPGAQLSARLLPWCGLE